MIVVQIRKVSVKVDGLGGLVKECLRGLMIASTEDKDSVCLCMFCVYTHK